MLRSRRGPVRRGPAYPGLLASLVLLSCGEGPGSGASDGARVPWEASVPEAGVIGPRVLSPLSEGAGQAHPVLSSGERLSRNRFARLFLNLDGVVVVKGSSQDSASNRSLLCGGVFLPLDHMIYGADRARVTEALKERVAAFFPGLNIEVVTKRPSSGPYEMVVVGGWPQQCGLQAGIAGLAVLDCGDARRGEVLFVFAAALTGLDFLALAIAHEVGHSLGLLHTAEPCDAMSPMLCSGQKTFLDTPMGLWPDHAGQCGQFATTNSFRALVSALGFSAP